MGKARKKAQIEETTIEREDITGSLHVLDNSLGKATW